MAGPIVYVGSHTIQPGKVDLAHAASADLASHLEAIHPGYLYFQITISEDGGRMTVLQVHFDEESMELHLKLAGDKIAAAYEFLAGTMAIDIFGDPSAELAKSIGGMAGSAPVTIHRPDYGFSRLARSIST